MRFLGTATTVIALCLGSALSVTSSAAGADVTGAPERSPDLLDCDAIHNPDRLPTEGLERTFRRWAEALAAADVEALGALLTEDVEFWSHGREPLVGRSAAVDAFRPLFATYDMEQEFHCDEIVLTPRWAFVRGTEVNRLTPRQAQGEAIRVEQRAFSVLRRADSGKWRFARGMTNRATNDQ